MRASAVQLQHPVARGLGLGHQVRVEGQGHDSVRAVRHPGALVEVVVIPAAVIGLNVFSS